MANGKTVRYLNGEVYTPATLAEFVAKKAITAFFNEERYHKKEENLDYYDHKNNFKIIDPACGNGELLQAIWNELDINTSSRHLHQSIYSSSKEILCGVDINQQALQSASSMFIDKYGSDINYINTDALTPLSSDSWMDSWTRILKLFGAQNGFDIVIANPPWGLNFGKNRKNIISKQYELAVGQYD